ncbi:transmembrane protein 245 isoform X4 [Hermetia illucens]|uniref:transmembrane protein 245 isoform X4 n=1 Tax=Hermetia illucens TaxID=343691 RepID=UPI0018CC537B|nr:transmembrane protein 245 isoform X4 [Hermetia illucens]
MYHRQGSISRDRSFENLFNKLWRSRSENHEGLKTAMYNFLIVAGVAAFAVVCVILGPFVRPLLWAFLVGAVLFPFKRKLASSLNGWFTGLEETDTNVFYAICMAPLEVTEKSGRCLGDWLRTHWQVLVGGVAALTTAKLLWLYAPKGLFCWAWKMVVFGHSLFAGIMNMISIYMLITIIAIYLTTVYFLWRAENSQYFLLAGQSIWIFLVGYACSFLGALQVPAFMAVIAYAGVAIFLYLRQPRRDSHDIIQRFSKLLDSQSYASYVSAVYQRNNENITNIDGNSSTEDPFEESHDHDATGGVEITEEAENPENMSNIYFKMLFYACIATFLYRNVWMFILAAIPLCVHLFNTLGKFTGAWQFIESRISNIWNEIKVWAFNHHTAVLPLCLPGLLELNYKIQTWIRSSLKSSVDLVTSTLMIILMILIVLFASVFICVNIYSETIEVAYLGKDLINKTITDHPGLIDVLPENIQSSIDDALDNAHHYGRRRLEQYIDDWLKEADPVHGSKLKMQILNVWDRFIQYWIDINKSDTFGPRVSTDALKSTLGEIVDNPVAKQGLLGWAKSNANTILEVAESVWHIIRANISMIMSFTGEIFSLVLSGGQAFVEFFLDMIVFFTALFYLLSSSNEKYAPLQVANYMGISSGSKIADALEASISGVLISMFKSAMFQGLFTWWIHTICGARIVFLPSVLAAFLSAAPFLGSYWCALPAFLELWLAQDRFYVGLVLFLLQFLVPPHVEQEIYAEMKGGGHPYLTGLAIAGGMYWIGWQGAIFGPLLLCVFIGIFEIATMTMRSDESKKSFPEEESKSRSAKSCSLILVRKIVSTMLPYNALPWDFVMKQRIRHSELIRQHENQNFNVRMIENH